MCYPPAYHRPDDPAGFVIDVDDKLARHEAEAQALALDTEQT